jgi:cell wall-associated NlpC family hydrolase
VRRVALLRRRVLLLGDEGAARVLDPRTGALTAPTADSFPGLLPAEALASSGDGGPAPRLYVAASPATAEGKPGPALVVALTPAPRPDGANGAPSDGRWRRWRLRAWRSGADGSWRPAADFATDADPDRAASSCVAAAPDALATAEREGPRCCAPGAAAPCDLPFALSPGMPSSTDKVAVGPGGGRVWWEQRGIVFGADPRTGARECYLPWNVPGGTGAVLALAADENGAWVATMSAGVRRIRPGRPNAGDGYDGYVRARLGAGTLVPPSARAARVAAAIDAWQGTRYVWGGQSRSGTDCSGFLMRMHQVGGVSIPRTTAEMRRSSAGRRVRDELRWGDTLVYPGHCAMYVGDGRTAETVGGSRDGSVSHSSVWVRGNVVVRRFLP